MQQTYEQLSLEICQMPIATVEDSLAKLSQLLEKGEGLKIQEGLFSLKSLGLFEKDSHNLFSLKMSKGCLITMEEGLSEQSSKLFGNWGMMSNGNCLTARILEYPKTEKGCSLSDILEEHVDEKYFLSQEQVDKLLGNL